MSDPVMMRCGHAANAVDANGDLCCVICVGIRPGATVVDSSPPSLDGRTARCYCGREEPSDPTRLAFFEHVPDADHDRYYCGCRGWD